MAGEKAGQLIKQDEMTTIRASTVVTGTYVAATEFVCRKYGSIAIFADITKGLSTTLLFKFEFSADDGTTYFQEGSTAAPSSGVSDVRPHVKSVTGANLVSGSNKLLIALLDGNAFNKLKVWVKGTGGTQDEAITLYASGGAN